MSRCAHTMPRLTGGGGGGGGGSTLYQDEPGGTWVAGAAPSHVGADPPDAPADGDVWCQLGDGGLTVRARTAGAWEPPLPTAAVLAGSVTVPAGTMYLNSGGNGWSAWAKFPAVAGTATALFSYIAAPGLGHTRRCAIYDDVAGDPTNRLGYTEVVSSANHPGGWLEMPLIAPVVMPTGHVWLWVGSPSGQSLTANEVGVDSALAGVTQYITAANPPLTPLEPVYRTPGTNRVAVYAWGAPA